MGGGLGRNGVKTRVRNSIMADVRIMFRAMVLLGGLLLAGVACGQVKWERRSVAGPNGGNQQTACIVGDFDKDGVEEYSLRCDFHCSPSP